MKKEKLLHKYLKVSANIIVVLGSLNIIAFLFPLIRDFYFSGFPNYHFIGYVLLYSNAILRIEQAKNEGKDPYYEASREYRTRKGLDNEYDFFGPTPDYSNRLFNTIYILINLMAFVLFYLNLQ